MRPPSRTKSDCHFRFQPVVLSRQVDLTEQDSALATSVAAIDSQQQFMSQMA